MVLHHVRRLTTLLHCKDPWKVLGVPRGSNVARCKHAFRKLALSLHPDVGGDTIRFTSIVRAYQDILAKQEGGEDSNQSASHGLSAVAGVRRVGDVLVVSIQALKQDPDYDVFAIRVFLETDQHSWTRGNAEKCSLDGPAVCEKVVVTNPELEVAASSWDSVADLILKIQKLIGLMEPRLHDNHRHRDRPYELVHRGQLLADHLLLVDYDLTNGDKLHFVVKKSGQAQVERC